jgi:hypothetical protein
MTPMYGTGWAHNRFGGPVNPQFGAQPGYGAQGYGGPPQYTQEQQREYGQGAGYQPSDGYYGQNNEGIQLQQPGHAYQPGGPMPSKVA